MLKNLSISSLIENKDFRKLKLFVDLGFEISLTEQNGDSLSTFGEAKNIIYDLIISNDLERIKKHPKILLNTQNNTGYSPLHWAIISQRHEITDYIISECSNHLSETVSGENCFSLAARYDNTYAFNKLMSIFQNLSFNQSNDRGFNALLFAASRKNISILESCIENSASLNLRSRNIYGANLFHWLFHGQNFSDHIKKAASEFIFTLVCKKMSKNDIKRMLNEENEIGYTPMAWLKHYDNQLTLNFINGEVFA